MRVIFLTPHLKMSGGTKIICSYADALAQRGHDVTVSVRSLSWMRRLTANLINRIPVWLPRDFRARLLRVKEFRNECLPDADVIIADGWVTARYLPKLSSEKGRQFQFIQHDERLYHGDSGEVAKTYAYPSKKIAVATWLVEMLKNDFGHDSTLLLNTTPLEKINVEKKDDGFVKILMLEHPYKWKGTDEGVKIVEELKEKYPNVRLSLVGARSDKTQHLCDEYIHIPDSNKLKLEEMYARHDIFLCPSWDEGFGLLSFEAMSCGTAVVTYDNGGSRDFAFDGETALVAPRGNIEELKQKLEQVIVDRELRQLLAKNAYEFIHERWPKFDWQVEKIESLLR